MLKNLKILWRKIYGAGTTKSYVLIAENRYNPPLFESGDIKHLKQIAFTLKNLGYKTKIY